MRADDDPSLDAPDALIPAATVVLVRDGHPGLEVLMLHRGSTTAFGGHWVFPGGRVDPEDADPAAPGDELAAARRAAVREAMEEAALAVPPTAMVPFAHWVPPVGGAPRRYATWFFLAPAPAATVVVDGGEIHDHRWLPPAEVLARRDAGEAELAPPTWVTLHTLRAYGDVASAVAGIAAGGISHYHTRIAKVPGGLVSMWRGDAGYDDLDPARPGTRHRLWMTRDAWRFERTG